MENKGNTDPTDLKIQGLIDRYLKLRSTQNGFETQPHLDEDTLSAFVEGGLSEREAQPVVRHLVDCSFCRGITAELVRLDLAFADNAAAAPASTPAAAGSQPSKISEVLSGVLARIFGTSEDAVFAHQEDEKEEQSEKEKNERK